MLRSISLTIMTSLLLVGCSGGDTDPAADTGAAQETAADAEDPGTSDGSDATQGGSVTIDGQTYEVVPDIQCLVVAEQVGIAGSLGPPADGEFTFDMFEPGDFSLQVAVDDTEWSAQSDAIEVEVRPEEASVAGEATVRALLGDEETTATFDITC